MSNNKVVINVDVEIPKIECGQVFIKCNEAYILCCVDEATYVFICLQDGVRWCDPLSLSKIREIVMRDGFMSLGNVKITIGKG